MKANLPILLIAFASFTITAAKASAEKYARSPLDELVNGFKTRADLGVFEQAEEDLAHFLATDPVDKSNDPDKKAALEKAQETAANAGYKIPVNTKVKVLKIVKDKDVTDYFVLDPTSHGRKEWIDATDLLGTDGMAISDAFGTNSASPQAASTPESATVDKQENPSGTLHIKHPTVGALNKDDMDEIEEIRTSGDMQALGEMLTSGKACLLPTGTVISRVKDSDFYTKWLIRPRGSSQAWWVSVDDISKD